MKFKRKKRTAVDFSKHVLTVEKSSNCTLFKFYKPDTICEGLTFINAGGITSVVGDWYQWMFYRSFWPSETMRVSDSYWTEKLRLSSCQNPYEFDKEGTAEQIKELRAEHLEEHPNAEEKDEWGDFKDEYMEWLNLLESNLDECEERYSIKAYDEAPDNVDLYDGIPIVKDIKYSLKAVYDAFDTMCEIYEKRPYDIITKCV